jgi:hypothetical protein
MRARWVSEEANPELPAIGTAIVASWWPKRYYWVSTIQLDSASPLRRLTEAIKTRETYEQVKLPDGYLTSVYRCKTSLGIIFGEPLYQREYPTISEARNGHYETVRRMAKGRLRLSPIKIQF